MTIKRGETIRAVATTARVRMTGRGAETRCTGAITCVAMIEEAVAAMAGVAMPVAGLCGTIITAFAGAGDMTRSEGGPAVFRRHPSIRGDAADLLHVDLPRRARRQHAQLAAA